MKIPKPSAVDRQRFLALVPADERVDTKPMFGNLGAFINGNMFMGLFGADVGVKLSAPDQERLRAAGGGPFGPTERPMSGYVTLPPTVEAEQSAEWIARAVDHVSALPPKKSRSRSRQS
ncbi:MAG TPA: TfoX/Sxy family protein [Microlunatus sp.]|nr:TfoX/Sxy family protein [Microlunatus sp.]